jgi:hypothetical protein
VWRGRAPAWSTRGGTKPGSARVSSIVAPCSSRRMKWDPEMGSGRAPGARGPGGRRRRDDPPASGTGRRPRRSARAARARDGRLRARPALAPRPRGGGPFGNVRGGDR